MSGLELLVLCGCERAAGDLPVQHDEHIGEVFDASVAVAQHPQCLIDVVIRPVADLNWHQTSP